MVQGPFIWGGYRKDLTRYLPCGGGRLINPTLTIYIIYIYIYIWVNYNDLTVLPKPGIMVFVKSSPFMAELFRLVNIIIYQVIYIYINMYIFMGELWLRSTL